MENAQNSNHNPLNRDNFFYSRSPYYGKFTPENLVFNANLQEFGQRISYICALETNGKLSNQEAYEQVKKWWHILEESKKNLGINNEE